MTELRVEGEELGAGTLIEPENAIAQGGIVTIDGNERLSLMRDADGGDARRCDLGNDLTDSVDSRVPPLAGILFTPPSLRTQHFQRRPSFGNRLASLTPGNGLRRGR